MALVISFLLASVILALAIVYALLMQMQLCRIFNLNITRQRKKAFFFWNSIAFMFKVVLPVVLLIPSGFLIWIVASHRHWGDDDIIAFLIAIMILVCALLWLKKGVQSAQRSFEEDYHQKRLSIPWWSTMLLTWLLAFPLSQLTVALCMGGHAHMHAHHWMNPFGPELEGDCWLCRMGEKIKELKKENLKEEKDKALIGVIPHLQQIVDEFNVAFMAVLPEWEREIEDSGFPLYMHGRGWNGRCTELLKNTISKNPQLHALCGDVEIQWIAEKMEFPVFEEWFGYVDKEMDRNQSFRNIPNPEGKSIRDRQKPRLARIAVPRHRFGYEGVDRDDESVIRRKFSWFYEDGKRSEFMLALPRNADRLFDTDVGEEYIKEPDVACRPVRYLLGAGWPITIWPSPKEMTDARQVGTFNDGYDELICFKVDEKEFKEEPLAPSVNFTEVQLYARAVPVENGGEVLHVTDVIARKDLADKAELDGAIIELRKYLTSKGRGVIEHLLKERERIPDPKDNLLIFEDYRKSVFIHWEQLDSVKGDGKSIALYYVLTYKWGFKGGVNVREHKDYGSLSRVRKQETRIWQRK